MSKVKGDRRCATGLGNCPRGIGNGLGAWLTHPVPILICIAVFASAGAHVDDVYFSSLQSIQVFANNTTAVVFRDPSHTGALVCNPNPRDHRIYWIDMESEPNNRNNVPMIKKGVPNNESSVEVVVSRDLHDPRGLAVDWAANNIYFSQRRDVDGHQGRIEVVSSDGRKRKVLFDTLNSVGSLAINILTGHLYFVEDLTICRCNLDGSNREEVLHAFNTAEVKGIAIDIVDNILYWADTHGIRSYDMDLFQGDPYFYSGEEGNVQVILLLEGLSTNLFELSVFNTSIYWTISRNLNTLTKNVTQPGSLYHSLMEAPGLGPVTEQRLLASREDIDPHGVCTFHNITAMSSPCYDVNDVCAPDAFCFAVPDTSNDGTRATCACPTGLKLNTDNRSCSNVPQNFLLYPHQLNGPIMETARTELRIIPLDAGDTFVDIQLPIDLHFTEVVFVTYDPIHHKVYWTEERPPTIMRSNIDGTEPEVFINISISQPESLAVDPYSGNLYWADSGLNTISVARTNNPLIRRVLVPDVMHPQGLAIDVARGLMYWTDLDTHSPVVERAHMDGTDRTVLSRDPQTPTNVAVDPLTGNVYWIEYNLHTQSSRIVSYEEGRQATSLGIPRPDLALALGLAVDGDHIYWTDQNRASRTIGRFDLSTSSSDVLLHGVAGVGGLVVVNTSSPSVDTMCLAAQGGVGGCNHLCLPSGNASMPTCACSEHHVKEREGSSQCVDSDPVVFVANGSYVTQLVFAEPSIHLLNTTYPIPEEGSVVKAMDVYVNGKILFWIDSANKRICSQSWAEPAVRSCIITCCLGTPEDLAVDWLGRNLYWTDSERRVIEVSSMTGHGRLIINKVPDNLGGPSHIALDPHGGHIYWASKREAKVYRTRMDGTQRESILVRRFSDSSFEFGVLGLALNFSINGGLQMYWAVEDRSSNRHLLRSDIDTSPTDQDQEAEGSRDTSSSAIIDQHQIVLQGSSRLSNITTLQVFGNNLLFNLFPRMREPRIMEFDGVNENRVFTGNFTQFVYGHHSNQEGEHRCGVNFCTENAGLCLVENGFNATCRCPQRSVFNLLHDDGDHNTCIVTSSFLVLATENEFSYLPVIEPGSIRGHVQPLPFLPEGRIVDFVYDPVNDSVLWAESGSNVLHGVNLDLESEWKILLSSNISEAFDPFSLAYDWRGGHVVLTETNAFQLKLVTADGLEHGSLLNLLVPGRSVVEKPGEVVFDAERSTLYWTQRDGPSDVGRGLQFMQLSDLSAISVIPLDGRLISNLTFEPISKSLYWISHANPNSIERYSIETRDITTITANATGVEALTALSVDAFSEDGPVVVPFVFWYNRTDQYLYNSTVDGHVERYVKWTTSERVVNILGHRTEADRTYACLGPDRPCSHICIPGNPPSTAFTCGCPVHSTLDVDGTNCIASTCGPNTIACGDDFGECYPTVYFCDGIRHCKNNFDEQCPCNQTIEGGCYSPPITGGSSCYSHEERCDGIYQCSGGEDEMMCCEQGEHGCYARSGLGEVSIWQCLSIDVFRCDTVLDCVDGSDEDDMYCATTTTPMPTQEGTQAKSSDGNSLAIIISAVSVSVVFVVMAVVIVLYVLSVFWRKRDEYRVGHHHHSMHYSTQSPQLRTDSTSDYSSEFSHGTNTTQLGNGTSAKSPCADKTPTDLVSHPNPPPSPISTIMQTRHSLALSEDDESTFSHEYNPPPPPCPSINYDNVSGNMSVSVSQTHFPATINGNAGGGGGGGGCSNNYHFQYPQGGHAYTTGVGGRPLGRNANPLYASNPRHQHFANSAGGHNMFQMRAMPNGAPPTNQQSNHIHYNNPYYHSCHAHPDITELGNTTHSDTDSTVSTATEEEENPDTFHFDSSMPHLPPPGRPPSPVTICSYPPGPPPHSPRSSTASYSSEV